MSAPVVEPGGPIEPLAESAPIAWATAPFLCPGSPESRDCCVWYHQVWQYLRLLEIITSIRMNTEFLVRTLEREAGARPRVLVTGTADYGMLAHLKFAYGRRPLAVTVVELCPTSLHLNRWYADRFGVDLTTHCGNALDFAAGSPFDVVCTHNFLGRFDPPSRLRLLERWHALLRPGGLVVTTQRVRPHSTEVKNAYSEREAREFAARVAGAAVARAITGPDPAALGEAAYQYAVRQGGYVFRSTTEIAGLFEGSGFDIESVDEGGGASERERDRPSSNAGKDSYRMRVVARKRM